MKTKLMVMKLQSQYKEKLNENFTNLNVKAFGILFRKVTPEDNYNEFHNSDYTWIEKNVIDFVKSLGYGEEAYDVATEVMDFCKPGLIRFGYVTSKRSTALMPFIHKPKGIMSRRWS
jgi:hypothetical protein